ncbi:ISAs1 family transposase [Streptomyces sp. NPDC052042]|uniref:ISAs1 family transposase n=1 Tax=Streptomyces sp. NPDC052042 TaxID=3365683 RepID=UPI0037D8F241
MRAAATGQSSMPLTQVVAATGAVGAFWLLPVKHNSSALHRKLAARPWGQVGFGARSRQDSHGRRETRTLKVLALNQDEATGLLGAAQVVRVHRYRRRAGRKASRRTVYYLTNLPSRVADPVDLEALVRGHRGIENKLHHVRDTVFGEDLHRARTGNLAAVHAVLRSTALNLLRAAGARRMKAALRAAFIRSGRSAAGFARRVEICVDAARRS